LKINSLNTNTNDNKYPIAFFVCWRSSSEVFFGDLGFDVRIEMQRYTKAVSRPQRLPKRGVLEAAFRASRHETNEFGRTINQQHISVGPNQRTNPHYKFVHEKSSFERIAKAALRASRRRTKLLSR
jgi:hypothetical protein